MPLRAFAWFLGSNDLSMPLVDVETGSCCDGLHPDRSNENRGGESVVSYLLALAEIRQLHRVGSNRLKAPLLRALHTDMPPAPAPLKEAPFVPRSVLEPAGALSASRSRPGRRSSIQARDRAA